MDLQCEHARLGTPALIFVDNRNRNTAVNNVGKLVSVRDNGVVVPIFGFYDALNILGIAQ